MAGNGLDALARFLGDFFVIVLDHLARFIDFFLNIVAGFLAAGGAKRMPRRHPAAAPITKLRAISRTEFLSFDMVFFLPIFCLPHYVTGHGQYEREIPERGRKKFRSDQRGRLVNFDGGFPENAECDAQFFDLGLDFQVQFAQMSNQNPDFPQRQLGLPGRLA